MDDLPSQPQTMRDDLVRCEVTGKLTPPEDIVEFRGKRVSAEGKDILLHRLKEGDSVHRELERPGFLRRLLCSGLDYCILWVVMTVFNVVFIGPIVVGLSKIPVVEQIGAALKFSLIIAAAGLARMAYYAVLHAKYGKTFGKMAGGYRVVNMDGTPISSATAFVRAFWLIGVGIVINILGLLLIGNAPSDLLRLLMALSGIYNIANCIVLVADSRCHRALHDRLAGTRVVMDM